MLGSSSPPPDNCGTTLLEFLVSSMIGSGVMFLLILSLKTSGAQVLRMKSAYAEILAEVTLVQRLGNLMSDFDSHTLPLLPRIHTGGRITFGDGSVNSISRTPVLIPAEDSSAVTYFSADVGNTLLIGKPETASPGFRAAACRHFSDEPIEALFPQYLAVGPGGFIEIIRAPSEPAPPGKCRSISFVVPDQSMLGRQDPLLLPYSRLLIPLEDIYTYYRDRSGNLRRVAHEGGNNVENQPVLENIRDFSLSIVQDPASGLTELSLGFKGKEFPLQSKIARVTLEQFLLYRP